MTHSVFSLIEDQDRMIRDLFELRYLLEPKMAEFGSGICSEESNRPNEKINAKD